MKRNITLISIGLSLLLMGCGSNSTTNTPNNTEVKDAISVPKNISVEMPKALQVEKNQELSNFEKVENETDSSITTAVPADFNQSISRGYRELQANIEQVEFMKIDLQVNLLLAEKVMPKITESCQDIPEGTTCTIESGKLSFILDRQTLENIGEITGEDLFVEGESALENKEIKVGETQFTQYSSEEDYQYVLMLDITNTENSSESENMEIETLTLKWSKDENHIWSMYRTKDSNIDSTMALRYLKKSDGQVEMEINDKMEGTLFSVSDTISINENDPTINESSSEIFEEKVKEAFNFKITNLEDNYKITSSSISYDGDIQRGSSTTVGELSDSKGGYLNFRGIFEGNEYREKEQFDANGNVIFSGYCDASQACDLNDESTWLQYGDESVEVPFESEIFTLRVTGGDLQQGQYILLSPNSKIENMSVEELFTASIGEVYVVEEERYGVLTSKKYLSELDNLVFVYLNMNFEEGGMPKEPTFEVVSNDKRPTLELEFQ